jgi:hypothetical protein
MLEAKVRAIAKRQPAAASVVVFAGVGINQLFTEQRLDQALETALGGGLQGIAQMIERDAVGLESLSTESFAPVSEQLLLLLRVIAYQVRLLLDN